MPRLKLARRDLADVPTSRLFALQARLRREAYRLNEPPRLVESTSALPPEETTPHLDPNINWEA